MRKRTDSRDSILILFLLIHFKDTGKSYSIILTLCDDETPSATFFCFFPTEEIDITLIPNRPKLFTIKKLNFVRSEFLTFTIGKVLERRCLAILFTHSNLNAIQVKSLSSQSSIW